MKNELIKIIENSSEEAVSARVLHKELLATERFSNWIERHFQYGFTEGVDYVGCKEFNALANQTLTDYALTFDCAKEIAMLQKNEIGKKIRRKLIELEKSLKNKTQIVLPQNYLDALKALVVEVEQKQIAQAKVLELTPKAEFYDAVASSKKTMSMAEVAKVLNVPGMGQNNLFAILREKKILMANNNPYQIYVTKGYFKLIEQKFNKPSGSVCLGFKTVVYQKGLDFIRKILTGQTLLQLTSN